MPGKAPPFPGLDGSHGLAPLERNLLKDRAADILRSQIISGRILPGARLAEREVAQALGISRAPARDALSALENEGLLVSKPSGRYVIELTEQDVRELYDVRIALERLAVAHAARHTCPANQAALLAMLAQLEDVVARGNVGAFVTNDIETHRLIWRQAQNRHLYNTLDSMVGAIFGFVASNAAQYDWQLTVDVHRDTIMSIGSGDVSAAVVSIERHLESALQRSLQALRHNGQAPSAALHQTNSLLR